MPDSHGYYLAGELQTKGAAVEVTDKFTGKAIARIPQADRRAVDRAIAATAHAADEMAHVPAFKRKAALLHVAERIRRRSDEFVDTLIAEAGKPVRDARTEVSRAIDTFTIAAEESVRIYGEYLPLDISPRNEAFAAITKRFPVGPCSFITPFNFPLNLCAHKVAPAIAAGCPFVLKPAPTTPISALMLGEALAETDLPRGAFSVLPCEVEDAAPLIEDERMKLLSFTGSAKVGWELKAKAGKKKVVLELGGNAACIVDETADLDAAAERIIFGAFYQSGQSCISVQRLLAQRSVYEALKERLIAGAKKLRAGDPRDEDITIGPLISEKDAQRIDSWVQEAVQAGARTLCGGTRLSIAGAGGEVFYSATILENVPQTAKLSCEEAFGPVLVMEPFDDFRDACAIVNESRYGLQAGVFTRDIHRAFHAFNTIVAGGVVINEVPAARVDSMPYGGVKDSGLGREGVRYAIQEMTELRIMLMKNIGLK